MNDSNLTLRSCKTAVLVAGMICAAAASAATPALDSALTTATQWVALADNGNAAGMWSSSSGVMQKNVPKDEWSKYLNNIHAELGKAGSREWSQIIRVDNPPNLPAGEYVNVVFVTRFDRTLAIEKISLSPTQGHWVPVGYVVNKVQQSAASASGATPSK